MARYTERQRAMRFFYFLAILFALSIFVFSLLNPETVALSYHFGSLDVPVSWLAIGMFFFGILFSFIALIPGLIKRRRITKNLLKESADLKKELASLRNGPIDDSVV